MYRLELGLVVIALIVVGIGTYRVVKNRSNAKAEAKKFLDELSDQMYLIAIEIINNVDIDKYNTFDEYKKVVLESVYNGCWEFIDKKVAEIEDPSLLSAIAKKLITREYVEKFVDKLLEEKDVSDTMRNIYGANEIEKMNDENDKEIQKEFSDQSKYIEDSNTMQLPPAEEEQHDESDLNPQKDEDAEEEYSEDDSSVEEVKEFISKITNKAGRVCYYLVDAAGKRKVVSKKFAEESGLEIK